MYSVYQQPTGAPKPLFIAGQVQVSRVRQSSKMVQRCLRTCVVLGGGGADGGCGYALRSWGEIRSAHRRPFYGGADAGDVTISGVFVCVPIVRTRLPQLPGVPPSPRGHDALVPAPLAERT